MVETEDNGGNIFMRFILHLWSMMVFLCFFLWNPLGSSIDWGRVRKSVKSAKRNVKRQFKKITKCGRKSGGYDRDSHYVSDKLLSGSDDMEDV